MSQRCLCGMNIPRQRAAPFFLAYGGVLALVAVIQLIRRSRILAYALGIGLSLSTTFFLLDAVFNAVMAEASHTPLVYVFARGLSFGCMPLGIVVLVWTWWAFRKQNTGANGGT